MTKHIITRTKTYESYPNICKRLPQEGDVKSQQTIGDDKLNEITDCFALLNQCDPLNNLETGKAHNAKNNTTSKTHKNRSPLRNKAK